MNNITGVIALLSLAIPGYFINSIILGKKRSNESLALSWISGSVVFTIVICILNFYLNIKLNLLSSGLTFLGITLISLFFARGSLSLPKFKFRDKPVLKTFILLFFVLAFATALFFPVTDWDAVTVYNFRARILLNTGFVNENIGLMIYAGYPMYTSLLHFWAYITGLWTAMPIYPLFTISFAAGVYFASKRLLSNTISLLIAFACLFTPRIFANSFIAYTNLPYTVFLILGALYVYLWTKEKNWQDLLIGLAFSEVSFWVRLFPFAVVNFGLILLAFPIVKKYSKVLATISAALILILYFIPLFHPVADYLKWAVYEYYSPYWLIFVALFVYNLIIKSKDWFWALIYIGYSLVLLVGTFIFNRRFPGYYTGVPDAVRRMMIFINLAVIFFAANTFIQKKEKLT